MDFEDLQEDYEYEQTAAAERARQENQELLEQLERRKRARKIAVPTDDARVRARLRELGEPITLFGERAADRRERLIYLLSKRREQDGEDAMLVDDEDVESSEEEEQEEFWTPGSLELLEARRRIAEFSLPRAQIRVEHQRQDAKMPLSKIIDIRKNLFAKVKTTQNIGSQIGDDRPVSIVRFSPNSKLLVTGSWTGLVKVWSVPDCKLKSTLRGHSDRVGGVSWHPNATISQAPSSVNLVSGAGDHNVHLWSLDSEVPISVLQGHRARVVRTVFHPSGDYVVSASFDGTWRLWDVETSKELLMQEGHAKEVFTVACQGDGSLVASAGLDAIGRVWDLRTGKTAMDLNGHVLAIYAMDFSPNGYHIATGGADDTTRIFDIRALQPIQTIPAHKSNVSDLRFFHSSSLHADLSLLTRNGTSDLGDTASMEERYRSGLYFASAGYDGKVNIWSADDWQLIRSLTADADKVMSVDIAPDGELIASGSFSRNYQLFAAEGYIG